MDNNQTQYVTYGFPLYAIQLKEDNGESVYSTPVKNDQLNKKTVYEVVVQIYAVLDSENIYVELICVVMIK